MPAVRVCVTGAAGQVVYSLLYSVAKGDVFRADQRLVLLLLDIPSMMTALDGIVMELQDCALPLLDEIVPTADPAVAFANVDVAILVGSMPRQEGMERKDLLQPNAKIFEVHGKALDQHAKKTVKVLVVSNPANTNCLTCVKSAPSIPVANFSCLTRLDHNRATAQIALRLDIKPNKVKNVIIWGNHSSTQFPDVSHATVCRDNDSQQVYAAVNDDAWLKGEFIKVNCCIMDHVILLLCDTLRTVQGRGAAVIKARKLLSAKSAAKAIVDHMRDWWNGTPQGEFISMGVMSDGSYDIPKDIIYSFPVMIKPDRSYEIVQNLSISDFAREKMDLTAQELMEERCCHPVSVLC